LRNLRKKIAKKPKKFNWFLSIVYNTLGYSTLQMVIENDVQHAALPQGEPLSPRLLKCPPFIKTQWLYCKMT